MFGGGYGVDGDWVHGGLSSGIENESFLFPSLTRLCSGMRNVRCKPWYPGWYWYDKIVSFPLFMVFITLSRFLLIDELFPSIQYQRKLCCEQSMWNMLGIVAVTHWKYKMRLRELVVGSWNWWGAHGFSCVVVVWVVRWCELMVLCKYLHFLFTAFPLEVWILIE